MKLSQIAQSRLDKGHPADLMVTTIYDGEDLSGGLTLEEYQNGSWEDWYLPLAMVATGVWD